MEFCGVVHGSASEGWVLTLHYTTFLAECQEKDGTKFIEGNGEDLEGFTCFTGFPAQARGILLC
jgi:hypothetical protein